MSNTVAETSFNFEIESPALVTRAMKNVTALLNSPNVTRKIESNPILQLDNPITIKSKPNLNNTKNITRKRFKSKIHCSPEMLSSIKKSSADYQKIVSKSDALFLKSDLHGVEIEVVKSKSFSLVGLKGIILQETFSTFRIIIDSATSEIKVIPKSSCIFLVNRNGQVQYLNGDQLLCSSGFRTSKKYKNKPTFYIVLLYLSLTSWAVFKELMSTPSSPALICLIIFRKTPNAALVASEYDLSNFGFFMRNSVQETITYLGKTAAERTPMGVRQSIEQEELNGGIGHIYSNMTGLAGFVGCKKEYPSRVAFALIDKALEIFSAKNSKEAWMSCTRPIESPWLKELFRLHKNPAEADSLTRVQQELDETKIVLHKTIESLLERGEKLDDMVSKSNELGILSKEFLKGSRKTNSCCVIQ